MQRSESRKLSAGRTTFQYPRSDRRRCNSRIRLDPARPGKDFQYPRSDRRRCNQLHPEADQRWRRMTFSILGRIGGDATSSGWSGKGILSWLSVSSVGSEAMQRCGRGYRQMAIITFSILGRIGGDATAEAVRRAAAPTTFQYPRSDRRRCNFPHRVSECEEDRLSVSSVGSEAMQQQPVRPRKPCGKGSFSILGRIGGDATCTLYLVYSRLTAFQYPRPDRRRCNVEDELEHSSQRALSVSSAGSEAMQRQG